MEKIRKISIAVGSAAIFGFAGIASAQDLVIVSWGGSLYGKSAKCLS